MALRTRLRSGPTRWRLGAVDYCCGQALRGSQKKGPVTGDLDVRLLEYLRAEKGVSNSLARQASPPPSAPSVTVTRPVAESTSEEMRLATRAIREADHPCPMVLAAQRVSDGSVRAACSNGEVYRVMKLRGEWQAMRCSAAERLGVSGC